MIVSKQSPDRADSEHISYVRVDHKRTKLINNKRTDKHSALYVSTDEAQQSPTG